MFVCTQIIDYRFIYFFILDFINYNCKFNAHSYFERAFLPLDDNVVK